MPSAVDGSLSVALQRLETLGNEIRARDWEQTEFQFDRVLRAVTKARDVARQSTAAGRRRARVIDIGTSDK